jgi:hypothetical protein
MVKSSGEVCHELSSYVLLYFCYNFIYFYSSF